MLADFQIDIHDCRKPLAVQVKIHDDVPQLRKAAQMFYNTWNTTNPEPVDHADDLLGVCHRFHMAADPVVAVVRLAPPNLGAGIVAHEMAHAALWLWEVHSEWKKPLCNTNDEWFCWVLGELVRQTTIKLLEKGIY